MSARDAVDRAAREASGRLVAALARRAGDLALAEDAVSHALTEALERWPRTGVPDDPEGWLHAVARRRLVGHWRHADVRRRKAEALRHLATLRPVAPAPDAREGADPWPDERLPLLFVCAHPAIEPSARAPLMLRAVLGLTAEEIGALLSVPAKTMGQRLWRAQRKIREARIPFAVPPPDALPERVATVLDALYGLYSAGWALPGEVADARTDEACWLATVVCGLLPNEPEALGLRALLGYVEARRAAGRDAGGGFVPLAAQDPSAWDASAIDAADAALRAAAAHRDVGPFQLEAAIQSAVVHGRRRGAVDHAAVLALYDGLVALAPTLGHRVGRAAVLADVEGPAAGLAALDALASEATRFQPWWAVRADLLALAGRTDEAIAAYDEAAGQAADPAVRRFLEGRRAALA